MEKKKTKTTKKSMYSEYRKETQEYMNTIHQFLNNRYGSVQPEWVGSLQLLATNYDMCLNAKDNIKENGLIVTGRFGDKRNDAVIIFKDAQTQVFKLLQEFGLMTKSINHLEQPEDETEEDYINSLTQ